MKKLTLLLTIVCAGLIVCAQADTLLPQYKGVYKFPEGSVVPSVEITVDNNSLMINSTMGSTTLDKIAKDTFNLAVYNGTVYFTRNADGKVDGIKIVVQDTTLEGKKQDDKDKGLAFVHQYAVKQYQWDFGTKLSTQPVQ